MGTGNDQTRVTIVITPREQFRRTSSALESVLAYTKRPYKLIYIDGGSPPRIRRYLRRQSKQHGFSLFRTEHYLAPIEARMLAWPHVRTDYVCFIDNDVIVTPGWLERLICCADETGAAAVGPLYCSHDPSLGCIHMAGGQARISENNGQRTLHEAHRFTRRYITEVQAELRREPTEMIEYHCMLLRTEAFAEFGQQDPRYLSCGESLDICLQMRTAGRAVYLEPSAVVFNQPPPPFCWSDLPYYLLRWSDVWNRISLQCFRERWNIPADDRWISDHYKWLTSHRQLAWVWVAQKTRRKLGWRRGGWLASFIIETIHNRIVNQDLRRRPERESYAREAINPPACISAI